MNFKHALIGLLLSLPLSASVTYEIPGAWSFTVPDFLQGGSVRVPVAETNYCSVWCDSVNFLRQSDTTYYTWVRLSLPNTPASQTAYIETDLQHAGTFGPMTITQTDQQLTAAPEPASYALGLAGLGLVLLLKNRRLNHFVNSLLHPLN